MNNKNINIKNALLEVQQNNWVSKVAKHYNISESYVKDLYENNLNGFQNTINILNEGGSDIAKGLENAPAAKGVIDPFLNFIFGRKPKVDAEPSATPAPAPAADPAALAREKTLDDLAAAAGATRAPKEPAGGDRMVNVKEPVAPPPPPKEPPGGDSMVKRKEALSPEELAAKKEAGARDQDLSRWSRNSVTTDMSKFRQAEVDSMKKLKDMEDAKVKAKGEEDAQTFRKAEDESMTKLKDFAKKAAIPAAVVAAGTTAALMNRDRQDSSAETPTPTTPSAPEEPAAKYKVAAGDTLSDLAKKNKVSVADIANANDLKDIHKINVGQELVIPKATGNQIYKYNVGTESGPKSSKDIKSLLQKQENRDRVNESLLAAFNEIVSSKHPNLFAEAAKKGSVPKTEKEKSLAALAEPKDKITHKDVLVGRGVVKEEEVGFSEAELAHIASIVEGTPIAPSPKKYVPNGSDKTNATGSKSGTLSDSNEEIQVTEAKVGRKSEEESLGDNMLHMNAKKAADNMANVKHKFASGEVVNMTKGMAVGFLNRHSSAKTADQKDAILKHANKSLDSFKSVVSGDKIPEPEKPSIKLGSMKGK